MENAIREERLRQGLTQAELGEKARLRRISVSNIERGIHSPTRLSRWALALALGVPEESIFKT